VLSWHSHPIYPSLFTSQLEPIPIRLGYIYICVGMCTLYTDICTRASVLSALVVDDLVTAAVSCSLSSGCCSGSVATAAGKCLWLIKYLNVFAALAATYLHFGATVCSPTICPFPFFFFFPHGQKNWSRVWGSSCARMHAINIVRQLANCLNIYPIRRTGT